jgi:16S rRNA (cytidine1402-2'-O)-methyltransferase
MGEERNASVCREISKLHETIHHGTLGELSQYFAANQAKGEIVVIVEGNTAKKSKDRDEDTDN